MNIVIDGWEIIESITWYLKNIKKTLPKFQIYIYIYIYIYKLVITNTYHIFWVYNLKLLQKCWNNREVDQESREDYKLD